MNHTAYLYGWTTQDDRDRRSPAEEYGWVRPERRHQQSIACNECGVEFTVHGYATVDLCERCFNAVNESFT